MNKTKQMQNLIHRFRDETGKQSYEMREVVEFAVKMGWPVPEPKDPMEQLANEFSKAAREETRIDDKTGRAHRANLAVKTWHGGKQLTLWSDIDDAPRPFAHKSFQQRREQMVGDAVQLTVDVEHWNARNKNEEQIEMPLDFGPDVQYRLNADDDAEAA